MVAYDENYRLSFVESNMMHQEKYFDMKLYFKTEIS